MKIEDFISLLESRGLSPRKTGAGWESCCPCHDDHKASLCIGTGRDGRILIKCQAGCSTEAIVAALGLKIADLFPPRPNSSGGHKQRIDVSYDYSDEAGNLLFQCVRFEPKDFKQRRPDPQRPGEWIWKLDGVRRVLYRLPEIVAAVEAVRTIFVVEGEKDADALFRAGFVATCNPMGADPGEGERKGTKWLPEHTEALRDAARVVIVADKDAAGRRHTRFVAASLLNVAKSVRLLELPDRDGKAIKDSSDWLAAGGSAEELRAMVKGAPEFQPTPEPKHCKSGSVASDYLPSAVEALEEEEEQIISARAWPQSLESAALHGLAGEVVRAIDPHTEADPAAVLVMFLAAFGNMAGANAHFLAESRPHPARIWPVLVGQTAKGRKGSAWSSLRYILKRVDEGWLARCTASGLSSGEGLIWAVRDPIVRHKRKSDGTCEEHVEDEGVSDKRLLTVEEEFSAVLKVAAREGNTVSDVLRRAWDHGDLRTMTRNSPAQATGAHVTVIGHITKADLNRYLTETDSLNGFGNRFLWLAVRRSKLLPEGGALQDVDMGPLIFQLNQALDFARKAGLMVRTEAAKAFWRELYSALSSDRHGILGALTNRAEAQVMRIALLYALLDSSPQIDVPHLQAANAVWNFCDRSARFIFGEALGDRVADRILDELRCAGSCGLTRNDLREIFNRNLPAAKIDAALSLLTQYGLAKPSKDPRPGGGRPAVVWRIPPTRKTL